MPFIEVRLWVNSPGHTPISGHPTPGWHMSARCSEDPEQATEMLTIQPLDADRLVRIGQAIEVKGHDSGARDIMPWIEKLSVMAMQSLASAAKAQQEAERKNFAAAMDLSKIAGCKPHLEEV